VSGPAGFYALAAPATPLLAVIIRVKRTYPEFATQRNIVNQNDIFIKKVDKFPQNCQKIHFFLDGK
jgi:hypothetical protein